MSGSCISVFCFFCPPSHRLRSLSPRGQSYYVTTFLKSHSLFLPAHPTTAARRAHLDDTLALLSDAPVLVWENNYVAWHLPALWCHLPEHLILRL